MKKFNFNYEPPLWDDEIWKPVVGYEGLYEVSNLGKIRNIKLNKYKSPTKTSNGYMRIGLNKNGDGKLFFVHRLVADAFLSNPDNLPCINHKDEDKTNNSVDNLEWCDWLYNNNYGTMKERMIQTKIDKGIYNQKYVGLNMKDYSRLYYQDHKEEKKKYQELHKEDIRNYQKEYYRKRCLTKKVS